VLVLVLVLVLTQLSALRISKNAAGSCTNAWNPAAILQA